MIQSVMIRNLKCQVVIDRLHVVEVLGESGVLCAATVTGWSAPSEGSSQCVLQTTGQRTGQPVEYVGYDAEGVPVVRGSCGPKGSGADWEWSRPEIQAGARVQCTWTHTEP